jgi:hypothetical protein
LEAKLRDHKTRVLVKLRDHKIRVLVCYFVKSMNLSALLPKIEGECEKENIGICDS